MRGRLGNCCARLIDKYYRLEFSSANNSAYSLEQLARINWFVNHTSSSRRIQSLGASSPLSFMTSHFRYPDGYYADVIL